MTSQFANSLPSPPTMNQNTTTVSTVTTEPTAAEIRERAYYLWLEHGCPPDRDQEMWFNAKILLHDRASQHELNDRRMLDARQPNPQHRFHNPAASQDLRSAIAKSGAPQRRRANRPEGGGPHHEDHPSRH